MGGPAPRWVGSSCGSWWGTGAAGGRAWTGTYLIEDEDGHLPLPLLWAPQAVQQLAGHALDLPAGTLYHGPGGTGRGQGLAHRRTWCPLSCHDPTQTGGVVTTPESELLAPRYPILARPGLGMWETGAGTALMPERPGAGPGSGRRLHPQALCVRAGLGAGARICRARGPWVHTCESLGLLPQVAPGVATASQPSLPGPAPTWPGGPRPSGRCPRRRRGARRPAAPAGRSSARGPRWPAGSSAPPGMSCRGAAGSRGGPRPPPLFAELGRFPSHRLRATLPGLGRGSPLGVGPGAQRAHSAEREVGWAALGGIAKALRGPPAPPATAVLSEGPSPHGLGRPWAAALPAEEEACPGHRARPAGVAGVQSSQTPGSQASLRRRCSHSPGPTGVGREPWVCGRTLAWAVSSKQACGEVCKSKGQRVTGPPVSPRRRPPACSEPCHSERQRFLGPWAQPGRVAFCPLWDASGFTLARPCSHTRAHRRVMWTDLGFLGTSEARSVGGAGGRRGAGGRPRGWGKPRDRGSTRQLPPAPPAAFGAEDGSSAH